MIYLVKYLNFLICQINLNKHQSKLLFDSIVSANRIQFQKTHIFFMKTYTQEQHSQCQTKIMVLPLQTIRLCIFLLILSERKFIKVINFFKIESIFQ